MAKSPDAFRTISEVSDEVGVPQHVLRFWETKFAQVKPMRRGGGRRYYRPDDIALLTAINRLLYSDGMTIKGVQKLLREHGAKAVAAGDQAAVPIADQHGAESAASGNIEARASDGGAPVNAADEAVLRELRAIRDRLASAVREAELA